MALNSAQSIFNLIRIRASKEYQDIVPALSDKSPIGDVATPILTNPLVFKEFSILLGALLEVEVDKRVWNNPLAELIRSNGRPLGEYSAEVTNNPVTPRPYDPLNPEKVLDYAMLDDKVAYYVRNVKELFKVSIAREDMMGAFQSYDSFNDYVSMKLASLESGRQLSMFNHVFEAIVANYNAGALVVSDVHTGNGNYANWTVAAKNAIDGFQYPSTLYNKYGKLAGSNGDFKGWTNADDIYIMATANWINSADVNFLATLFNIDRAELQKRIIKVIDFGYDAYKEVDGETVFDKHVTTDIDAIIFDRRMLHFTSDLDIDDTFYNPETLVTNYYKHWWATYQLSPFANCIVFTQAEPETPFELSATGVTLDTSTSGKTATLTYTPTDAEVEFGFVSGYNANGAIDADDLDDYITESASSGTITFTTKSGVEEFVALITVNGIEVLINGMQAPDYDDITLSASVVTLDADTGIGTLTYTPTDATVVIAFNSGYDFDNGTYVNATQAGQLCTAESSSGTITFTSADISLNYVIWYNINGQIVRVVCGSY